MQFSQFESEIFNLNVYRDSTWISDKTTQEINDFIDEQKINIIRFNIDSRDKKSLKNIYSLNYKIYYIGSTLNLKKDTRTIETFNDFYSTELIDAINTDQELIKNIINEIFGSLSLGYANLANVNNKITLNEEHRAISNYILSFLSANNAGIQLLKNSNNNEIIGMSTYSIKDNQIYRDYAGITPAYRSANYYDQLIVDMIRYNYVNNLESICYGVRSANYYLINKYIATHSILESINNVFVLLNL